MDKLLETYSLPKVNPEKIDNLNRPLNSSEIEFVIKTTLSKQMSRTRWLHMVSLLNT